MILLIYRDCCVLNLRVDGEIKKQELIKAVFFMAFSFSCLYYIKVCLGIHTLYLYLGNYIRFFVLNLFICVLFLLEKWYGVSSLYFDKLKEY